jgi:hypothetical protein
MDRRSTAAPRLSTGTGTRVAFPHELCCLRLRPMAASWASIPSRCNPQRAGVARASFVAYGREGSTSQARTPSEPVKVTPEPLTVWQRQAGEHARGRVLPVGPHRSAVGARAAPEVVRQHNDVWFLHAESLHHGTAPRHCAIGRRRGSLRSSTVCPSPPNDSPTSSRSRAESLAPQLPRPGQCRGRAGAKRPAPDGETPGARRKREKGQRLRDRGDFEAGGERRHREHEHHGDSTKALDVGAEARRDH